jgi:hypothetical protein
VIGLLLWTLAAAAPPASWTGVAPPPAEARAVLEFERVNGLYSNPDPELEPVQQGPITVQLRSPENSVELFRHRLALVPMPQGRWRAQLAVEFEGEGKLEADVSLAGMTTLLKDEVRLPRQQLVVTGTILMERVDQGYRVLALELPPNIEVALESRLATNVVVACRNLTRFLPLVGCTGLKDALRRATVPLPPAGTELFLPDSLLTDPDRATLNHLLGGR